MRVKKIKFNRSAVAGVCWFFGFLFAFHAVWILLPGLLVRDFWDPQYAMKFACLKARVAADPNRPLWLILGSSRVEDGVDAGVLNGENTPLIFNFGMGGADLFRQMICLQRLIGSGYKPQSVGIEIMDALLGQEKSVFVDYPSLISRARLGEVATCCDYSPEPDRFRIFWLRSRFDPIFEYGTSVEHQRLFRGTFSRLLGRRIFPYDDWGWLTSPHPIPRELYPVALEAERKQHDDDFKHLNKVSRNNDRALRQILDLCKREKIGVFLFGMPESVDFQAFYPAEANAMIGDYLRQIESEYDVKMIDARSWIEREGFTDGHHLNAAGAEKFSRRFSGELFELAKPPERRQ